MTPTDRIGEDVRLFRGDALAVLRGMPDASVDLVVTSPPYNLGNTAGGGFPNIGHYDPEGGMLRRGGHGKWKRASAAGGLAHGYGAHDDAMPHEDYVAWQKECLSEMWRVVGPNGAIFYNHKPRIFSGRLVTPLEYNPGLPVRQIVIWARAGGINFAPTHYVPTHEWVVIFAKDGFRLTSKGASGVGDVWSIPQEASPHHPAPFPVRLPRTIIETTGATTIFDPFMGSGTTGIAALRESRKFIGIELDPTHYATALKRLRHAAGESPDQLFGVLAGGTS